MITRFSDNFRFLSNFWPCEIQFDGYTYPSVEHAYQAAKTLDPGERKIIRACSTPGRAKRAGRKAHLRPDWDNVKLQIMSDLVTQKFTDPNLARKLRATSPKALIEGNNWHDNFWGICLCPKCKNIIGQNHLGTILMKTRAHSISAARSAL